MSKTKELWQTLNEEELELVAELDAKNKRMMFAIGRLIDELDYDEYGCHIPSDHGCILCTYGAVPNDKNTGLCGYHLLEKEYRT